MASRGGPDCRPAPFIVSITPRARQSEVIHKPDFLRKTEETTDQLLLRARLPDPSATGCEALSVFPFAFSLSRLRPLVGDGPVALTTGSAGTSAPGGAKVKRGGRASSEFGGTTAVGLVTPCVGGAAPSVSKEVPCDVGG